MQSSSCPVCDLILPLAELERHANSHFEEVDDELARDMELAQHLALAPPSPPRVSNNELKSEVPCVEVFPKICETSTSRSDEWTMRSEGWKIDEKVSYLKALQIRSIFYRIEGGLLAMLRRRLELEFGNSTSILSGYVDHFQSIASEDVGWGCGWRNIQMISSHLLMQRKEAREVLFGGSGFVPDIPSLQRWLEIAWERGFDATGSAHFNTKIYGSRKWIGTTECAALLRSFGIRARIVDFGPKELESLYLSVPGSSLGAQVMETGDKGKRKAIQVHGPMDKFLRRKNDNVLQESSGGCEKTIHPSIQSGGSMDCKASDSLENNITRKVDGYQVLIDWVWNYFSDNSLIKRGNNQVFVSNKAPLYFQHDGHSRTIIGIQVKHQQNGVQIYSLLILDPAHRTADLERSLKENVGWQKRIKRGVHTLKKPQYQLCYIDEGIASGEEMEQLKIIDSIFLEI